MAEKSIKTSEVDVSPRCAPADDAAEALGSNYEKTIGKVRLERMTAVGTVYNSTPKDTVDLRSARSSL